MILVTGGTGYIGSHTAAELLLAGYEVLLIDNLCNSDISVLDGISAITGKRAHFTQADVTDLPALRSAIGAFSGRIEGVIHFAALKAVGESVQEPLRYYRTNVGGLLNLVEVMVELGIANLVFSSSCTVYGQPDHVPVDESAPRKEPTSPYGNTKRVGEDIIRHLSSATALRAISLRYFNPIGAHPSARIGELPIGVPNNLVPFLTQTAIGKRDRLTVFGNDYPTPDGSCVRDFIHVCDLAKAHISALQRLVGNESGQRFEVFNIGTGDGVSVLGLISAFERVTGIQLNTEVGPRRPGDVASVYADPSKANRMLGWRAGLSVEDALLSAWEWEKKLAAR